MSLKDCQESWCRRILTRMRKFAVAKYLNNELICQGVLNFDDVLEKLNRGEYKAVEDWAKDVNLIFFNVRSRFAPDSPQCAVANYLSSWFQQRTRVYPETEMDVWMASFKKVQEQVRKLMQKKVNLV